MNHTSRSSLTALLIESTKPHLHPWKTQPPPEASVCRTSSPGKTIRVRDWRAKARTRTRRKRASRAPRVSPSLAPSETHRPLSRDSTCVPNLKLSSQAAPGPRDNSPQVCVSTAGHACRRPHLMGAQEPYFRGKRKACRKVARKWTKRCRRLVKDIPQNNQPGRPEGTGHGCGVLGLDHDTPFYRLNYYNTVVLVCIREPG